MNASQMGETSQTRNSTRTCDERAERCLLLCGVGAGCFVVADVVAFAGAALVTGAVVILTVVGHRGGG